MSEPSNLPRIHELCGALHLHTTFSDGGVDYPTLIAAAKEVGLDYIVVSDHMTLKGREAGFEGFSGNLLVIVGYEHNDADNINHYLALRTTRVCRIHDRPQNYIDEIKKDNGIGFLAHPVEKRHYFKDYPAYPWTAWESKGFDGIELWNQMSDWLEHLKSGWNFFQLFCPRRLLQGMEKDVLDRWDSFNRGSFVSGIGGVDAHTMKTKIGLFGVTIFPIKVELKGIRTHLFLEKALPKDDLPAAQALFFDALKNGRGFISNFRRGDARGTRVFIEYADGSCGLPGPQRPGANLPARIRVELPAEARIRLIRNGGIFQTRFGASVAFDVAQGGLYRIEAHKGKYAWIYSNPFPIGGYPLW